MEEPADDAMIVVAALVSRVEALVTASMLEAAEIMVHVGGAWHASAEVNSLALGGHRLWIPASQHEEASAILRDVLGEEEWSFSYGLQMAVLRVMGLWVGISVLTLAIGAWLGANPWTALLASPLAAFTTPANPQGRGDYYLRGADGRTYWA